MSAAAVAVPPPELDRRLYAYAIDRLLAWSVGLVAAVVLRDVLVAEGSDVLGLALVVLTVLAVGGVLALVQGLRGVTPGKAVMGLRVVALGTGEPIGVGPALLRGLVLGVGGLPTFGLGLATLARTAVTDRDRRRRGWHDHVAGSVVVDVRPAPQDVPGDDPAPRRLVNLTAMRLVPAPAPVPVGAPGRGTPTGAAVPGARAPATPSASRWRVSFDTGESFVVDGVALLGRRPESRVGEEVRRLVPLRSEDMSLSKTHARLQVAPDGALVVTDRGSTTGSVLVRRGVPRALSAGTATTLLDGDVVRFGDRTMTVAEEG